MIYTTLKEIDMNEYHYPNHWAFRKFERPSAILRQGISDPYGARVKAVEIKRAYKSHRFSVPGWVQELTA